MLEKHFATMNEELRKWQSAPYERCIKHEDKLVLQGITIYPDFVIRHPVSGEYYYWEHFEMMDEKEYRSQACNKIKLYCEVGISEEFRTGKMSGGMV